jgi:hypothetical protein
LLVFKGVYFEFSFLLSNNAISFPAAFPFRSRVPLLNLLDKKKAGSPGPFLDDA